MLLAPSKSLALSWGPASVTGQGSTLGPSHRLYSGGELAAGEVPAMPNARCCRCHQRLDCASARRDQALRNSAGTGLALCRHCGGLHHWADLRDGLLSCRDLRCGAAEGRALDPSRHWIPAPPPGTPPGTDPTGMPPVTAVPEEHPAVDEPICGPWRLCCRCGEAIGDPPEHESRNFRGFPAEGAHTCSLGLPFARCHCCGLPAHDPLASVGPRGSRTVPAWGARAGHPCLPGTRATPWGPRGQHPSRDP